MLSGPRDEFLFEPIHAPTLKDNVAKQIRSAILTGDLGPGSRIVESKLARQMNVAQSTVREAIQDLENQGLVVKYVNRETLVRSFTIEDLEKIFRLRMELEGFAMELAHPYANEQSLVQLFKLVDRMRDSALKNAIPEFYNYDLQFHARLWALANSEFLERALMPVSVGPIAFVLAGSKVPLEGNYVQVAEDHAELLDCLLHGTPQSARRLLEDKLQQWHELQIRSQAALNRERRTGETLETNT
jgi:DNA-binding GntR family transcriptional regulator